jgi:hypothetical protein
MAGDAAGQGRTGGNEMYLFVAHYINMDTDEEIKRKIEIEEQFF